jgi:hypothetical protein|tara:strand:- start:27284 stop:27397 length:114 start_codon:yes stop_codon:yes gene_type:complete
MGVKYTNATWLKVKVGRFLKKAQSALGNSGPLKIIFS